MTVYFGRAVKKCFCFMGIADTEIFWASNSAQKISHGMHTAQTISDKEEGAARHLSKCRFYPSNGAGLSIAKKEEENVGTQRMTVHTEMCIW